MKWTKDWLSVCLILAAVALASPSLLFAAMDEAPESITDDAPLPWFVYTPVDPKPGDLVTFDASPSQGKGGILSYQWDTTGDGRHDRAGAQIRQVFNEAGTYDITLTVHDGLGRVAKVTRRIYVGASGGVELSITTDPPGLTVYIDGERRGQTPLAITVEPGQHQLRLRHYWLSDWETTLDVRNVKSLALNLVLAP